MRCRRCVCRKIWPHLGNQRGHGALPTNLTLLGGVVRGGVLVRALAGDGLRVVGELPPAKLRGRWAFESYPHAGMV